MSERTPSAGRCFEDMADGLAALRVAGTVEHGWRAADLQTSGPDGDVAIGVSSEGDVGVLIPLESEPVELPAPSRRIRTGRILLQKGGANRSYVVISSNDPENERRFLLFCADLLEQGPFLNVPDLAEAIARSVQRFRSLLYPEDAADTHAAIGLLGEMMLLQRLAPGLGVHASQWTGPSRQSKDIDLGHCQIEVKTTTQLDGWRLLVHGLHQLACGDTPLVMIGLRITETTDGVSLPEVASWLRRHGLGDPQRLEIIFEAAGLAACESALGDRRWTLRDIAAWRITPDFPRIEPGVLSGLQHLAALDSVQYVLDLTTEPEADAEGESPVLALIKGLRNA